MRRVWAFPDGWAVLDDDGVWNLLDGQLPSPLAVPFVERRAAPRGDHRTVVAATAAAARARSRAIECGVFDPLLRSLRKARGTELFDAFGVPIEPMRGAVHAYTTTLKRDGTTPEHAVVLVKAAIQEGLGGPAGQDEPGAEDMMSDAVVWCIEAYYGT